MRFSNFIFIFALTSCFAFASEKDSAGTSTIAGKTTEQPKQYIVDFDQEFFTHSPYQNWMRDPFKNMPGFAKTEGSKSIWPKLDEIHVKKDKASYVLLDGKKYKEGQFIDPNRYISAIGENYVTISEGNYDYELVLKENDETAETKAGTLASQKKDASRSPASTPSSMKESQK